MKMAENVLKMEDSFYIPDIWERTKMTDDIQVILDEYLTTNDVKTLEKKIPERAAHVMDVIFKESVRTFEEDETVRKEFEEKGDFTGAFYVPYKLFDKDKVFFLPVMSIDDEDFTWRYPITITKLGECIFSSPFKNHNYVCVEDSFIDDDGLIDTFRQDIDIFGDEKTWKEDLIKALYMTVSKLYSFWEYCNCDSENEKFDMSFDEADDTEYKPESLEFMKGGKAFEAFRKGEEDFEAFMKAEFGDVFEKNDGNEED